MVGEGKRRQARLEPSGCAVMNKCLQKTGSILQTWRLEASVTFNQDEGLLARLVALKQPDLFIQVVPDKFAPSSLCLSLSPAYL